MSTIRQKRVAKDIAKNLIRPNPLTGGEIVEKNGYGPSMKKNPQSVINSIGVTEELKKLGFDSEKAKEVVGEILIAGENDSVKLKAADTIFKVNGDYAPEKHVNLNVEATPSDRIRELADRLLVVQSKHGERRKDDTSTEG